MLKIYNSLTREKEQFNPLVANQVGIYVCGLTVYDYCHLGHARLLVCFDVVTRYLRSRNYQVNYVRNITDIDDKIINRANERQQDYQQLTDYFINAMHEDERALYILPPDQEPRATTHMAEIIQLISKLIDKGIAYKAENGDVYYDVTKFTDYGKLSRKDIEGQEAGARVEVVNFKKNPLDFALWKQAKPGEPQWDSPWGVGRPGWHIECSAMSMHCLGEQFDIHGGGYDLQFPHHENEIAQSEGATGKPFANLWMHAGFLQINYEKMSKSLDNFFTIREILKIYPAETIRYFLLSSHYRSQLNYSTDNLDAADAALRRFYTTIRGLDLNHDQADSEYQQRFVAAMNDDFNTPEALAVLFELTHEINRLRESDLVAASKLAGILVRLGNILGIMSQRPEKFLHGEIDAAQVKKIEQLIAARNEARKQKAWVKADEFRDQLHALGIELEDSIDGTIWRRAKI